MSLSRSAHCALLIAVALIGCRTDDRAPTTQTAQPPEVIVAQVVSREVTDYAEFTGRTESAETVDIRSRVTGYLDDINFIDGQEVKKGDVLFQIDPRPFQADLENAEGQKAQWEARQARARADVQRYESLVPTGAASAQDRDKARADLGEAIAAIRSAEAVIARARLDLEFARVTAPIDGQISRALITRGNLIRGDQDVMTTIVSMDPMYVYFDVDERTLLQVRRQAAASSAPSARRPDVKDYRIPVRVGLAHEQGYPHLGIINFADNRVDPSTGTIRIRGIFDNSQRIFKPGFFVRVRVLASASSRALLVIDRAIAADQGQRFVYVVDDRNIAQYRVVQPGRLEDDGLRVIPEGLQPGEWVIVTGLQRARPGKPVTPVRGEMTRAGAAPRSQPVARGGGQAQPTQPARQP